MRENKYFLEQKFGHSEGSLFFFFSFPIFDKSIISF